MRRLIITETDAGQWIVETSSGTRAVGATLVSALDKLVQVGTILDPADTPAGDFLQHIFVAIPSVKTGQIVSGQAGA